MRGFKLKNPGEYSENTTSSVVLAWAASQSDARQVLEIGASYGGGSTLILAKAAGVLPLDLYHLGVNNHCSLLTCVSWAWDHSHFDWSRWREVSLWLTFLSAWWRWEHNSFLLISYLRLFIYFIFWSKNLFTLYVNNISLITLLSFIIIIIITTL